MKKCVITVVGMDAVGIMAKVCTYLSEANINVLDISQTIVQEYFNMMMIVELEKSAKSFDEVQTELTQLGIEIGMDIKCQNEKIFKKMHRI